MPSKKTTFAIKITCPDVVPQLQKELMAWAETQDQTGWVRYGCFNLTQHLDFFIRTTVPLADAQIAKITHIIEKHSCTFHTLKT
jgi:hypothetical protein